MLRMPMGGAAIGGRLPSEVVDARTELLVLAGRLQRLHVDDREALDRFLAYALAEAASDDPDPIEIGGALERMLKAARRAPDFCVEVGAIAQVVGRLALWIGPGGSQLVELLGIDASRMAAGGRLT